MKRSGVGNLTGGAWCNPDTDQVVGWMQFCKDKMIGGAEEV